MLESTLGRYCELGLHVLESTLLYGNVKYNMRTSDGSVESAPSRLTGTFLISYHANRLDVYIVSSLKTSHVN